MKKSLLSLMAIMMVGLLSAQVYPYVDINQIQYASPAQLVNCNDSSAYVGDTIRTRGIVVIDGSLSEVASSSITGGSRPFISLVDTANNGTPGHFKGIVVMGVNWDTQNTPNSTIENVLAGDIIEMVCVVGEFNGALQLQPLNSTSVSVVGFTSNPTFVTIPVSDIQDQNRQNLLPSGEKWDGSYVEIQNVTVVNVSIFSGGSRCEFTVADANGNQVLIADRFLPMRVNGVSTVNPNSPRSTGNLVPPTVGTAYNYIRGLIFQDENGCAGGSSFAGGYELNPFDSTHFDKAASPPSISLHNRVPNVPNASQSVNVSAEIVDNDGIVTSATLYYSADRNAAANTFSSVAMTNSGSIYSATIPAFPLDSVVRYYIEAIDDSAKVSTSPGNGFYFYTVRPNGMTIMDVQYVLPGSNGDSPYSGDTVTVTGIVTGSYQPNDIGYLYMQDPNSNEYAGLFVEGGGTSVFSLNRGDEITVNGIVQEQFGFTKLSALSVTSTGNTGTVNPIVLNPSDTNYFTSSNRSNLEPYESMLIRYENPMMGGKVNIINPNLGFGEYTVGSGAGATTDARVLAGRQDGTSAQSSLNVSVLSDTAAYGGNINVPAVQASITQNMDALMGMLYYSFSNFKLTPRNNADFVGFNQPLVSVENLMSNKVETAVYPNPANDRLTVQLDENYDFNQLNIQLMDVNGRVVVDMQTALHLNTLNLSGLNKGFYFLRVRNGQEDITNSKVIIQ